MLPYTVGDRLLTLDRVSLSYRDVPVLRDVSAIVHDIIRPGVEQGQVVAFLGPSGIGKTQLSRVIAGLQPPTSGRVLLAQDAPVKRGLVGMVPQHYPLWPFLTVSQHLKLARAQGVLRDADAGRKQAELVEVFGLAHYLPLYPHELSGGTRQRVAIVRQLLCSEHVLVMDEPFSGLDPIMKRRAVEVIRQVAQLDTRNTIIVVTHDIHEGMSVADRIWLMGRDRQPDGVWLPGARIVEEHDLAAQGLAWRPDIDRDPAFQVAVEAVKVRFAQLVPSETRAA